MNHWGVLLGCAAALVGWIAPVHAGTPLTLPEYLGGKQAATRKLVALARATVEEKTGLMAMAQAQDDPAVTDVWAQRLDKEMAVLTQNPPQRPVRGTQIEALRAYFSARYHKVRFSLMDRAQVLVDAVSKETFPKTDQKELAVLRVRVVEARWMGVLAQAELADVMALQAAP
jgi:hypothetical protein